MEIASIQRPNPAADVPIERLAGNVHVSEAAKLGEVSRQFEAVLLRQILGDAQKQVFTSTMHPESVASGVYRDMVTDQLAESISRAGAFGLAASLKHQLQPKQITTDVPAGGPKV